MGNNYVFTCGGIWFKYELSLHEDELQNRRWLQVVDDSVPRLDDDELSLLGQALAAPSVDGGPPVNVVEKVRPFRGRHRVAFSHHVDLDGVLAWTRVAFGLALDLGVAMWVGSGMQ